MLSFSLLKGTDLASPGWVDRARSLGEALHGNCCDCSLPAVIQCAERGGVEISGKTSKKKLIAFCFKER